jgi:UDP-glucose 4-epimerase
MSKVLVTGGAGFIGSHLVRKLVEDGHEVVVADILLRGNKIEREILDNVEFHKADVKDRDTMMKLAKGCNQIFHFAAVLGVDVVADNPVETMETEVLGMHNIAEAASVYGTEKIIYASTSGIYGHSAIEQSVTEEIIVDPRTSYAIAKRYNEIYLRAQYEEKGLESVSLRFFNVYGKRQDNRMVVPRFIEQAQEGKALTVYGNGMQTRDFTYIDDTIRSCTELAAIGKAGEIYNIANETELTILDLAKEVIKITDSSSEIQMIEAPKKRYDYEVERRFGNSTKLFNAIGYKPDTTLDAGLRQTLEG